MTEPYGIAPLGPAHQRSGFTCGVPALDRYLREQASQDMRRRVAACFVATELAADDVVGFYTLAAASIVLGDLPEAMRRRLPRYPSVPVARLGRLAVHEAHRGRRLGIGLLWDAVVRAARSDVAVFAMVVDAKDEAAAAFYRHNGFTPLAPLKFVLPLAALKAST